MKKLLCRLFGHNWTYIPKPDILSTKRKCDRCQRVEKRIEFIPRIPHMHEKWIGIS